MAAVGEVQHPKDEEEEEEEEASKSIFHQEFRAERVLSADCANEGKRPQIGDDDDDKDSDCTLKIVETDDLLL